MSRSVMVLRDGAAYHFQTLVVHMIPTQSKSVGLRGMVGDSPRNRIKCVEWWLLAMGPRNSAGVWLRKATSLDFLGFACFSSVLINLIHGFLRDPPLGAARGHLCR